MGQLLGSPEPGESLAHGYHPGDLSAVPLLGTMANQHRLVVHLPAMTWVTAGRARPAA